MIEPCGAHQLHPSLDLGPQIAERAFNAGLPAGRQSIEIEMATGASRSSSRKRLEDVRAATYPAIADNLDSSANRIGQFPDLIKGRARSIELPASVISIRLFLIVMVVPLGFRVLGLVGVDIQPFGYAFIDFAGSRSGWPRFEELPHVHALMMIHPATKDRFDELRPTEPILKDLKQFNPAGHDAEYIASYCMKGVIHAGGGNVSRANYWEPFPFIGPRAR